MVDVPRAVPAIAHPHRPWLAATLSFAFPGLGQAYSGRRRFAVLFAVPALLLLGLGLAIASGFAGDPNVLLSTQFLLAVLVVNGALLAWRIASIVHAGLVAAAPRRRQRRIARAAVIGLVAVTIGMHAWVNVVVAHLEETLSQVFAAESQGSGDPPAAAKPAGEDPASGPIIELPDWRWDGTERINVLMLGTDAAPSRDVALTDVILVVSVDPVDETAVMISVPRDTGYVPLPNESVYLGGVYPEKINGLAATAAMRPDLWCPDLDREELDDGGQACGLRTVREAVGLYLGIEIHHHAVVDMAGFAEMIDAVGGLDLCLPGRLVDPEFDGSLENLHVDEPLVLPAGCHHYDGLEALAYARSRKGWIEMPSGEVAYQTDFDRSERQQLVLLALRQELARADTFFELPGLLGAIGRTVATDFPRDQAGDLASLLPLITGPDIERIVLGYPEFVDPPLEPDVNYLLIPKRDAIRDEMAGIFGEDELRGWYLATDLERPELETGELQP